MALFDNNIRQDSLWNYVFEPPFGFTFNNPGQIIRPEVSFTPDRLDIFVSYATDDFVEMDFIIQPLLAQSDTHVLDISSAFRSLWVYEDVGAFVSKTDWIAMTAVGTPKELVAGTEYVILHNGTLQGSPYETNPFFMGYDATAAYRRGVFFNRTVDGLPFAKFPSQDLSFALYGTKTPAGSLPGAGVGEVNQADATPTPSGGGDRPSGYNPDQVWNENVFVDIADATIAVAGGGRWQTQMVVTCNQQIYFEEIS